MSSFAQLEDIDLRQNSSKLFTIDNLLMDWNLGTIRFFMNYLLCESGKCLLAIGSTLDKSSPIQMLCSLNL